MLVRLVWRTAAEVDVSTMGVVTVVAPLLPRAPPHPRAPAPHQITLIVVHASLAAVELSAQASALISQMLASLAWLIRVEVDASMTAAASVVTAPLPPPLPPPVQAPTIVACTVARQDLAKSIWWRQQGPTANQAPSWRSSWLSVRTSAIPTTR